MTLLKKINKELCEANYNNNSNKIPVLVHGYAHPIPDGEDFGGDYIPGLPGPWLKPAFENKGYFGLEEKACMMKKLIDRFNCMLKDLCETENFSHIDVQHVDLRACLSSNLENDDYEKYWADELHPTKKGFKLIAKEFHCVIKNLTSIPVRDNQNA